MLLLATSASGRFPAARFGRFAESGINRTSRLLVVDEDGTARDASYFATLECADYHRKSPEECGSPAVGAYAKSDAAVTSSLEHLFGSVGAEGIAVTVIRRTWFINDEEFETTDCPIAKCRAVPR
jgi:hypothetical protein